MKACKRARIHLKQLLLLFLYVSHYYWASKERPSLTSLIRDSGIYIYYGKVQRGQCMTNLGSYFILTLVQAQEIKTLKMQGKRKIAKS